MRLRLIMLLLVLTTQLTAYAAEDEWDEFEPDPDPWIGFNQKSQKFNDAFDKVLLKPLAKGYSKVVPGFARQGVGNFFANLDDISNALNNVLQGKPVSGLGDVGRVLINSTLGIGGLFDPASGLGLKKHQESFGQTLSVWGVPSGPYLVIPFLGPSTVTDMFGRPVDSTLDPLRYLHPVDHRNRLYLTRIVDQRESVLAAESVVFGDRYLFLRDAYLQRREYLVTDGKVDDSFDDF